MGFFGKKKKEENENKDFEGKGEKEKGIHIRSRKIKDLKPENRRRRKEPIRPWSKYDRVILVSLIVITFFSSFYFALSAKGFEFPNVKEISFPKINFFSGETIVLTPNDKKDNMTNMLTDDFTRETKDLGGKYGFYYINLDNGTSYGVYEDSVFQAASLIKLPVMLGIFIEAEKNNFNLDMKYLLKTDDKVSGSGSLSGKPDGYELTFRDLLKLMGKESDNTAFNICRKFLGDSKIQKIIEDIGMDNTSLKDNNTTPKDVGLFFQRLWKGSLINEENKNEFIGYLTNTIYENWLTPGVPKDIKIAHKYGRETNVVNDAGIVFSKPEYVVVILSKNINVHEADLVFPKLSDLIYRYNSKN